MNSTNLMPVLFVGHGSPMNAIEENEFTREWAYFGKKISKPVAVLCISAHWETRGTYVTAIKSPVTIHDFGGFPHQLYEVHYPAPGSPELAEETKSRVKKTEIGLDHQWGLDHGCWSVIKHMFPEADVPVIQFSIDHFESPQYHYDLARELTFLRKKGVLIVGSGNMVHNLGLVAWDKMSEPEYGFDWALEASENMKKHILSDEHKLLIGYKDQGRAFNMAIPTPEHYLPLLYALALKEKHEDVKLFNDKAVMGSLTMTSVLIGRI